MITLITTLFVKMERKIFCYNLVKACIFLLTLVNKVLNCEISSSHGGGCDVQSCLLGCTAV
jgi:hypothetical protein